MSRDNDFDVQRQEAINMAVMAKPGNQPFTVREEDWDSFVNNRTPKDQWKEIMELARFFTEHTLKTESKKDENT